MTNAMAKQRRNPTTIVKGMARFMFDEKRLGMRLIPSHTQAEKGVYRKKPSGLSSVSRNPTNPGGLRERTRPGES